MRCYAPDPASGSNSAPPDLTSGFLGKEGKGKTRRNGKERAGKRKGKEKKLKGKKRGGNEKGTKGREGGGRERERKEEKGKGKMQEFCAVVIFS